jgi:proton-translocating NADH-quinone oxidoreductase chain N
MTTLQHSPQSFLFERSTLFQSSLFENDLTALIPELFLISTTLFLLVYGVVFTTKGPTASLLVLNMEGDGEESLAKAGQKSDLGFPVLLRNVAGLVQLALFYTLLLLLFNPIGGGVFLYSTFLLDSVTFFFKLLVICGTFFSLEISLGSLESEEINSFEFSILLLLSTGGMLFLISAGDLLSMYLGIEFQALCFYVVAGFKRDSEFSTEAGVKYFLLGAFSSGLLLFGCSLLYGFTGVVSFWDLAQFFSFGSETFSYSFLFSDSHTETGTASSALSSVGIGCEVGMIFLLVGFLFKLTAVPFHMWAPDVYEGAPLAVTGFFSIVPKAALLAVFIRLLYQSFFDLFSDYQPLLLFCAIGSMIGGSFAGLAQLRVKRLLAYSSIGHVGYLLLALSCGTLEGIQASVIYLVIYMIMTTNIFALLLAPLRRFRFQTLERIKYTTDLAMIGKTNPLFAITLAAGLFSIAGIPPLAGFYSKAFLFWSAISSSQYLGAFIGILSSAISCFYYIRIVNIMYFQAPPSPLTFSPLSKGSSLIAGASFLFLVGFMGYPAPLYVASHKVALALSM